MSIFANRFVVPFAATALLAVVMSPGDGSGMAAYEGTWSGAWDEGSISTLTVDVTDDSTIEVEYCFEGNCSYPEVEVTDNGLAWGTDRRFTFQPEGQKLKGRLYDRGQARSWTVSMQRTAAPDTQPIQADTDITAATESALADSVYRGEWRNGYLYEITFNGAGSQMRAVVHVIDSDSTGTEYRMPARVKVSGNDVKLRFTQFDRVDHLTFDPERLGLTGYTVFEGRKSNRLWAWKVTQ